MATVTDKTAAQLAADAANVAKLNNFAMAKDASLEKMRELGRDYARGQGSITLGAYEFGAAVLAKLASEENAFDWYQALAIGFNELAPEFAQDAMPTDAAGLKQSVSIFRTFGRSVVVAVTSQVPGFYDRVVACRNSLTKEARAGSAYNSMAVANRRITDAIEGGRKISELVADLTGENGDKLITSWIEKETKAPKSLPEVLRALAKSMESKADSTGFADLELIAKVATKVAHSIEGQLANADTLRRQASIEAAAIIEAASIAAE
jgi:hypothetical protein